jgi:hypothetical protein
MPTQTQMKKGSKNQTTSVHRKECYQFYKAHTYALNKLKRILQSCGEKFARKWATSHAALGVLAKLLK